MDNKTQLIQSIRYNANSILSTSRATTATLPNYRYLLNLGKRMDTIAQNIVSHDGSHCALDEQGWFVNLPVANIVANSIHKAISNLIPVVPVLNFDYDGVGEDLHILVNKAINILQDCDEDGLASNLSDRFNTFIRMMEIHEELELQWLTDLAND